jgi:hypothetical protein
MHSLGERFVGREAEQATVLRFLEQGEGTLLVEGPPGIGKSALLARTALEMRAREQGTGGESRQPNVPVEYFARRGTPTARPTEFLRTMNRRLDVLLPGGSFPPAESEIQLDEGLQLRLQRAQELRVRVVLLLDGLDEAPDLIAFVPRASAALAVVCGSRPFGEFSAFAASRVGQRVQRLVLGPLGTEDTRAILYGAIDKYDPSLGNDFLREVAERSGGNPLFLKLYCDQLFHAEGAGGSLAIVPISVAELHKATVSRITRAGADRDAYRTLLLFAEVREPLDRHTLTALLNLSGPQADACLEACSEVLVEGVQPLGYQLFHESLREWLHDHYGKDLQRARWELAERGLELPDDDPDAEAYLARWGIDHLLEALHEERSRRLRQQDPLQRAVALLSRPELLQLKLDHQNPHHVLEDLARVHAAAQAAPVSNPRGIPVALARVVAQKASAAQPQLNPQMLHAVLNYRPERALYDDFLGVVTDPDFIAQSSGGDSTLVNRLLAAFRLAKANRLRQSASAEQLEAALALLEDGLDLLHGDESPESLAMQARAAYDRAYILYLRAKSEGSITWFGRSRSLSRRAGDAVGEWISYCLETIVRYYAGLATAIELTEVLRKALAVFEDNRSKHAHAERWVTNAYAYLFDLACDNEDRAMAAEFLDRLERHSWIRAFGRDDILQTRKARYYLLAGEHALAASMFWEFLVTECGESLKPTEREGLAREFHFLAQSLAGLGRDDEANENWQRGLACSGDSANWHWQERIRQALQAL